MFVSPIVSDTLLSFCLNKSIQAIITLMIWSRKGIVPSSAKAEQITIHSIAYHTNHLQFGGKVDSGFVGLGMCSGFKT